ncbi:MAG: hypothetical protein EA412_13865 [Chitinophagaceae bacterium]|nr:MAG: hypothetical protein EA412_13865 [Chitinophagaceae bacterium]
MIKYFTLTFLLLISTVYLFSQNVGVGTDTPGARLEIKGETSTSATSALDVTNESEDLILRVRNDGNVGIGTANPQFTLDVAGSGRFTGQVSIPLLPVNPEHAASKQYVDNQIAGQDLWQEDGNDNIYYDVGNVAIGTDDPLYKFYIVSQEDVAGTNGESVNMENGPFVVRSHFGSGSGQMTGIGFTVSSVDANVGGAIALERMGLQSQSKMHFAVKSENNITADIPIRMTLDYNGRLGIGNRSPEYTLDVSGTGRFTDQLIIPLVPTAPEHAASKEYVDNQLTSNTLWQENGNNIYYDDGDVGIGTADPISALHVRSNSWRDHIVIDRTESAFIDRVFGITQTTSANRAQFYFANPDGSSPNYALQVQEETLGSGARVGIGLGSVVPSEALDVNGNIALSGDASGTVFARNLRTHDGSSLYIEDASGNRGLRLNSTGVSIYERLAVGTSDPTNAQNNGLYVSGNTGLGNINPQGKLHISLDNSANEPVIIDKANGTGNGPIMEWYGFGESHRLQLTYTDSPFRYEFNTDQSSRNIAFAPNMNLSLFLAAGNQNVGIKTENPTADLDIDGEIRIRGGNPQVGRVLTSDADGNATWQDPSGGGGSSNWTEDGNDNISYGAGSVVVSPDNPDIQANFVSANDDDVMLPNNRVSLTATYHADFRRTDWSNGEGNGIKFTQGENNTYTGTAAIVAERTGSWSQGKLHFAVNDAGSSGKTDIPILMTLDGPGNEMEVFGDIKAEGRVTGTMDHFSSHYLFSTNTDNRWLGFRSTGTSVAAEPNHIYTKIAPFNGRLKKIIINAEDNTTGSPAPGNTTFGLHVNKNQTAVQEQTVNVNSFLTSYDMNFTAGASFNQGDQIHIRFSGSDEAPRRMIITCIWEYDVD